MIEEVISGGQTGADKTGLVEAKRLGFKTGGTAPKGYRTDEGPDYSLRDEYGLVESDSPNYSPRTIANVRNSDTTIWFGKIGSPGYWCTKNACKNNGKTMWENPTELQLTYITSAFKVVNIAGNRRRLNPAVVGLVEEAFAFIGSLLEALRERKDGTSRQ